MIRWQEQYSPEERRVTRECLRIIAELPNGLLVRDDVLVIPEGISADLQSRIVEFEPYLRWAAGKEANAWLPGGPANFPPPRKPDRPGPNGIGPAESPSRITVDNTSQAPDVLRGRLEHRTGAERQNPREGVLGHIAK
jgi:hypothetical protein